MQCDNTDDPAIPVRVRPAKSLSPTARVKCEERLAGPGLSRIQASPKCSKRTVCDHCRRRRIRCDGGSPCKHCEDASLNCKREHVPRKRGPKRGHGRVINELRALDGKGSAESEGASGTDIDTDFCMNSADTSVVPSAAPSPTHQPFIPWTAVTSDPRLVSEPRGSFSTDTFRPNCPNYLHLIPRCVDLYYEHIYPIMPLVHIPTIRATIARPMTASEKNLIYALSALTSFHMAGKSLSLAESSSTSGGGHQPSWDRVGRFFLDECIAARQSYDFPEDDSLAAVISSFWLSTSFFEINQSRKSWYYLREALTAALDLRLHDDRAYAGLSPAERLCRQRVFWQLFVTERSFAILRNKPLTLRKTPSLPTTRHDYEEPEIHAGFLKLVSSYVPLDESFVNAWNDGSDPSVSATTYLNLQQILAQPLDFLRPRRKSSPDADFDSSSSSIIIPTQVEMSSDDAEEEEVEEVEPNPTDIQKADLLMTQQWLRLIVWQSSFRQGLLSTAAPHASFGFGFPLAIARDTAAVLQSLPSRAVEVHGMGIFEKIFEIGVWCVNVLHAYDANAASGAMRPFGGAMDAPVSLGGGGLGGDGGGMDFLAGDMSLLSGSSGRGGVVLDPLEFFVKTLSASPNSKTMYADKLLLFAGETAGAVRMRQYSWCSSSTGGDGGVQWDTASEEERRNRAAFEAAASRNNSVWDYPSAVQTTMGDASMPGSVMALPRQGLTIDLVAAASLDSGGYGGLSEDPLSAGLSVAFSDTSEGGNYGFGSIAEGSNAFINDRPYMETEQGGRGRPNARHNNMQGEAASGRPMGVW
ncbi:C6 zinc finger domain containing protein [Apiospora marii]|uniref:C6 zinc finger domain containing protein n=1 Tax=Apiospora marii TaxID=335849 RepID=A0ABR1RBA0_9PEZI